MTAACANPADVQPADLTLDVVRARMAPYQPVVDELLARYPVARAALLQVLWLVQDEFGWVPRVGIRWAAEICSVGAAHAFGVVEFYTMYRQVPTGRHLIQVCQTMACYQQGAENLIAYLEHRLGIHCGGTTSDGLFTLVRVECLALCGTGPGVMIDDQAIGPTPFPLGHADLTEGHLSVPDFHPTSAVLDAWIDFLRAQPAPARPAMSGRVAHSLGNLVLRTHGHPGAPGARSAVLPSGYAPAPPALKLAAQVTGESVALTWLNDALCSRIVVERSDDQGQTWREIASVGPKEQKAADRLAIGVSAHYRVIAHEKDRVSKPSAIVPATGQPPPVSPAPAAPTPAKA
jgi:NADH:ubiquinone oxidoreductase subunit E